MWEKFEKAKDYDFGIAMGSNFLTFAYLSRLKSLYTYDS